MIRSVTYTFLDILLQQESPKSTISPYSTFCTRVLSFVHFVWCDPWVYSSLNRILTEVPGESCNSHQLLWDLELKGKRLQSHNLFQETLPKKKETKGQDRTIQSPEYPLLPFVPVYCLHSPRCLLPVESMSEVFTLNNRSPSRPLPDCKSVSEWVIWYHSYVRQVLWPDPRSPVTTYSSCPCLSVWSTQKDGPLSRFLTICSFITYRSPGRVTLNLKSIWYLLKNHIDTGFITCPRRNWFYSKKQIDFKFEMTRRI